MSYLTLLDMISLSDMLLMELETVAPFAAAAVLVLLAAILLIRLLKKRR